MCVVSMVFLSVLVLDFVVFVYGLVLVTNVLRSFSSIVCCRCGHQLS